MKSLQKNLKKVYQKPERRSQLWKFFWWPSEMEVYEVKSKLEKICEKIVEGAKVHSMKRQKNPQNSF